MTRHRRHPRVLTAAPLLLVLALTACGADTIAAGGADTAPSVVDEAPGAAGGAASSCLEGSTDCDDTPGATGTGGVESAPDGSVPVGEAVAAGIQGPFLISGFLVVDASGARLCEALAESFPPQCGGTSVPLQPAEAPPYATTITEGDVTWTDQPLLVGGEIVDGAFVVRTPEPASTEIASPDAG